MAGTLLDLANRMRTLADKIGSEGARCAVETTLAIVGDLARVTPVDTSRAVSNWQVTLDSPSNKSIFPHFAGFNGSTFTASGAETVSLAKQVLRNKKPGQIIFIKNNLTYISALNEGSSMQEPAGFVERAVLIGRKTTENFKIKIKG